MAERQVDLNVERKYEHVVVVGIDGAGAFIKDADTPYFDRIFKDGAVTYKALASRPTISAECWGSMLLGVAPEIHGLTNGVVGNKPYPTDSRFPSVFRRIREVMPDAELGSFCDWNSITYGIVENNLDVAHDTASDTELTPVICQYIREKKPTFLFVQMDSVDGTGHKYGYGTPQYMKRIHEVDMLVNDIYTAICNAGMRESTLFMVIADHGGTDDGNGGGIHGGWSDEERLVTFAAAGKGVQHTEIQEMNIRDLAAIILYALGISAPELDEQGWTSQIPEGIWVDERIPTYHNISLLQDTPSRISKTQHTSQEGSTRDF